MINLHTDRCRFAKTDVTKCKCSCKGYLHGNKEINRIGDILMTEDMGGEVAKFIKENKRKKYYCYGNHKHNKNIHTVERFYGYEHPAGLADKNKKTWWIYVMCNSTGYQTSFMHLLDKIKMAKMEREYISDWEVE